MKSFIGLLLGLICFAGLLVWSEYSNWTSQVSRLQASLIRTSEALVQHADDVIEMARLPLASLITEIADEEGNDEAATKLDAVIARQMRASATLFSLSFADASGHIVATSYQAWSRMNVAEQDFFRFHRFSTFALPVLGRPYQEVASQEWLIPISQRVANSDGSFGGVVVSTVRVYHFLDFVRHFDLGNNGSFLLVRGDGFVLARAPMQETLLGTNISAHELFTTYLKRGNSGTYRYRSPVDGTERFGGYYRSTRTGLVVLSAASQDEFFDMWVRESRSRWLSAGFLLMLTAIAALRWHHQSRLRKIGEDLIATREAEFRLLAESSSDLIQRFDENGVREYVSPSASRILGFPPEKLIGTSVFAGLDDEDLLHAADAARRLKSGSPRETIVTRHIKPNGEEVWLDTSMSRLPTSVAGESPRAVAITRDVTSTKKRQDELDMLANNDALTGLANRRHFDTRLTTLLRRAGPGSRQLSLIMLDADRFKQLNDIYGHAAGDACLRELGEVLRQVVRQDDVATRYGGEELAVLLPGTDARAAVAIAARIQDVLFRKGRAHSGNPPWDRVTLSMGIATTDDPDTPAEAFVEIADRALYEAKRRGRNQFVSAHELSIA